MTSNYFSIFHFYTLLLFLTVSYLVFLRIFFLPKYIDFVTKITISLTTYLSLLFLAAFCLSLLISISFYGVAVLGEALGWYISHELDLEKLRLARESSPPGPGDWVMSIDKGSSGEWICVTKETVENVETECKTGKPIPAENTQTDQKQTDTGKSQVNSPSEKKSFLGRIGERIFNNSSDRYQQKAATGVANFAKQVAEKSNMEAENEKTVLKLIDDVSNLKNTQPATQVDLSKFKVKTVLVVAKRVTEDGCTETLDCFNIKEGFLTYRHHLRMANPDPKMGATAEKLIVATSESLGFDQLICFKRSTHVPSFNENVVSSPSNNITQPPSPTGGSFDNFN